MVLAVNFVIWDAYGIFWDATFNPRRLPDDSLQCNVGADLAVDLSVWDENATPCTIQITGRSSACPCGAPAGRSCHFSEYVRSIVAGPIPATMHHAG
jgi:hypothetical protein